MVVLTLIFDISWPAKAVWVFFSINLVYTFYEYKPGRVAQSVGHLTRKSGVLGSIPGLATYFRFSFRSFKKGSCRWLVVLGLLVGWLVGCLGFNGPLRQYFSLYRAVSQREGERGEKG